MLFARGKNILDIFIMVDITFNREGHDGFIDFIKTYAILAVLIGHTFPYHEKVGYGVWLGMQVPLFILVQTFHCYKREKIRTDLRKAFLRVFVPFFILELLTLSIAIIWGGQNYNYLIDNVLHKGGFGPGSYYPWIYIQFVLLLPFFSKLLRGYSNGVTLAFFLILSEGFEVLFSIIHIPNYLYRLLAIRYFFLIWLGWQWAKDGIKVNRLTHFLSVVSLVSIVYFEYYSIDNEPLFFLTDWKYHRWPCYFFVAYDFTILLNAAWKRLCKYDLIEIAVKNLAAASYEIFLIQMSLIFLFQYDDITVIHNRTLQYLFWVIIVWSISIIGGIIIRKWLNGYKMRDENYQNYVQKRN